MSYLSVNVKRPLDAKQDNNNTSIRVSCRTIGFSSHTVNRVKRGSTAQPVDTIYRDYAHMHKRDGVRGSQTGRSAAIPQIRNI